MLPEELEAANARQRMLERVIHEQTAEEVERFNEWADRRAEGPGVTPGTSVRAVTPLAEQGVPPAEEFERTHGHIDAIVDAMHDQPLDTSGVIGKGTHDDPWRLPVANPHGFTEQTLNEAGFVVKDSGARQNFDSGMVRDTEDGKPDFTLIRRGPMFVRWAIHMTKGALKYGRHNWTNANSEEEYERFRRSAARHFEQWLNGERDEDHAAAVMFNINAAEYVREGAF